MSEVQKHQEQVGPKVEKQKSPSEVKTGIEDKSKKIAKTEVGHKAGEQIKEKIGAKEAGEKLSSILHSKEVKEGNEKVSEKLSGDMEVFKSVGNITAVELGDKINDKMAELSELKDNISESDYERARKEIIDSLNESELQEILQARYEKLGSNIDLKGNSIEGTLFDSIKEQDKNLGKVLDKIEDKELAMNAFAIFGGEKLKKLDFIIEQLMLDGNLPEAIDDINELIEKNDIINEFSNLSEITDNEKKEIILDTKKMSGDKFSSYMEKTDNRVGSTGIDHNSPLDYYSGAVSKDPKGLTGRVSLKENIPNTHIKLNEHYLKYTIDAVPEDKKQDVLKVIESMPKGWEPIVCRNAIKNPNFSSNKPFIAQNLTYKTAVIYYPGKDKADVVPVNHGSGKGTIGEVSNIPGSHGTSLGSKELVAQGGGKYKFRVVVKGLEPMVKNFKLNRGEAMKHDPSEFGNANDESRLIRIHETKESHRTTWGCSGLASGEAKKLHDAIKKAGGGSQEIFSSIPA